VQTTYPSAGGTSPPPDEDYVDRAVLGLLLERHPGAVPLDELARELVHASQRPKLTRPAAHDGVAHLVAAGLARRHADFVVASRAAVRFDELGL
jgi:hypothetical protein